MGQIFFSRDLAPLICWNNAIESSALAGLEEVLAIPVTPVIRDAAILRFA